MEFRFLSLGPRVSVSDDRLIAQTAWTCRILTLGLWLRKIVVDSPSSILTLQRRWFWLFSRRRRIRFEGIEAVTYGYEDWAISSWLSDVHDSFDFFSVGLRLNNGDHVHLFTFFGDGTFVNNSPWPDAWFRSRFRSDVCGTQDRDSRAFVDVLCERLGVSVIPG